MTLIIPQKNHVDLTVACIKSLRLYDPICWPVVIIDDGSHAREFEKTQQAFAKDKHIRLIQQLDSGISAAWNTGFSTADTKYLLFLNNDVRFRGHVIEQLLSPLKHAGVVLSGVKLRNEKQLPSRLLHQLPVTRFLEGWCFGMLRDDVEQLGGFDESMRLYWSDTDFQLRLLMHSQTGEAGLHANSNLPITHLKHQTAHRLTNYQHYRAKDRATFISKWKNLLKK